MFPQCTGNQVLKFDVKAQTLVCMDKPTDYYKFDSILIVALSVLLIVALLMLRRGK